MVRGILFDIDGTLLDHVSAERAAVQSLYSSIREWPQRPSAEEFVEVWHGEAERHMALYLAGELTFVEQRVRRVQSVFATWGREVSNEEAIRIFGEYHRAYQRNWRLYEDVLPCLHSLKDYVLGVVSNGDSEQQRRKLRDTGIASFFKSVVISADVGVPKPNAAIFQRSLRDLGLFPTEAAFVGDSLETDAIGASRAGLHGVWLNRLGVSRDVGFPVVVIASLQELPGVVGSM